MKCVSLVAMSAVLLLGSQNTVAQTQDDIDVLLGAAAGAAIGSTIGDGDGRTIATAIGGLIGANMARDYSNYDGYGGNQIRFRKYCRNTVPDKYRSNPGVMNSWISGCMTRLQQLQIEKEQQAFEEALNGPAN